MGQGTFENLVSVAGEFLMDFGDLDQQDRDGRDFQALAMSPGGLLTIRQEEVHNDYNRCSLIITQIKGLNEGGRNRLGEEMRRISMSQVGLRVLASGVVNLMSVAIISTFRREGNLFKKLINSAPTQLERSLRPATWMNDS